jgi:hypothetical protein
MRKRGKEGKSAREKGGAVRGEMEERGARVLPIERPEGLD